jgi:hypothetical protein
MRKIKTPRVKIALFLLFCFCSAQAAALANSTVNDIIKQRQEFRQRQMQQNAHFNARVNTNNQLLVALNTIVDKSCATNVKSHNKLLASINATAKNALRTRVQASNIARENHHMATALRAILAQCDNYAADPLFSELGDTAYLALRNSGIAVNRYKYMRKYRN